jgi:hemerythrin-like domain-containing protein
MGLKRHAGLQPLSRQHRDLLIQAHDLRDAAKGMGLPAAEVAQRFLSFWARVGEDHFRYEENELIACYANHCDIQHEPAIQTMLREHTEIRHVIEQLASNLARHHDPTALLATLGMRLDEHIRYEERVVFTQIQERVPEAELLASPQCPACGS